MATYYIVEGREFIPGEKDKALRYAKELANSKGKAVTIVTETGSVVRDPSGFVYDFNLSKRSSRIVQPDKRKSNPSLPRGKWIPAHAVKIRSDGGVSIMGADYNANKGKRKKNPKRRYR